MIDVANLPHDFCIGCYVPRYLWDGEEPPHGFTDFIAAIKAFSIVDEIETEQAIENAILLLSENICGFNAVTVVPSHSKGGNAHAGIFRIAAGLAERSNGKVIDATSCLHRIHTVEKLAGGGDRAKDTHINSIQLRNPDFIKGKKVLLLDDVRCTGNSLAACREILEGAYPKAVHPFALAQSLNDNGENLETTYARVEYRLHMAYQIEHQGLDFEQNREQSALSQMYDFAR
ncbi:MAG: hypothetical protein DCF15_01450 [Phormidesmis priestleyi]|uniref:Phosphoribosyltransferase n=1 Tax=Phormidesmis priestleyi TaxID=268141 RepID=A0A2W4XYJ3_9CYAN|nr:MAG: hypothetical protein DCF15_01450 [Phormidesmis priestleyi]